MTALDVEPILGPAHVGSSIATFLLGLITVQVYLYYKDYPHDPLGIKLFVAAVWLSEIAHQVCSSWTIYYYNVKEYGSWEIVIVRTPVAFNLFILFHGLTILLVSAFYIHRLWNNTKDRMIALFLGISMAIRSVIVIVIAGAAFKKGSWLAFFTQTRTLLTISMTIVTVTEVLLTCVLCFDLHLRRNSPLYKTWMLVDRAIMWCFATGIFTSLLAVLMTILFVINPDCVIWLAIFITLSRFFCISFLASMNARGGSPNPDVSSHYNLRLETRNSLGGVSQADTLRVLVEQETCKTRGGSFLDNGLKRAEVV